MSIEQELSALKERNARVETDKAWERSRTRIGSVMLITYIVAGVLLAVIGNDNVFRNALVPVVGYLLSTQSLPFMKRWWIKHHNKA